MNELRTGCLVALGGYAALVALYGVALRARFPDAPLLVAPTLALFALFVLGPLKSLVFPTPWARALRRHGKDPRPVDAAFYAAEGSLVALGETLVSPLQQRACVHYEAEVYRRERLTEGGFRRWYDWTAVETAPCAVETPLGRVQLLGRFLTQHVPGDAIQARRTLDRSQRGVLAFAILLFLAAHAFAAFVLARTS